MIDDIDDDPNLAMMSASRFDKDVRERHTRAIEYHGKYTVEMISGIQAFKIGTGYTLEEADWTRDMLAVALTHMRKDPVSEGSGDTWTRSYPCGCVVTMTGLVPCPLHVAMLEAQKLTLRGHTVDAVLNFDEPEPICELCGRTLNQLRDPLSLDCGGHCLSCMASNGDPDAIEAVARVEKGYLPLDYILSINPEVMSGRLVFAGTRVPLINALDILQEDQEKGIKTFLQNYPSVGQVQFYAFLRALHGA